MRIVAWVAIEVTQGSARVRRGQGQSSNDAIFVAIFFAASGLRRGLK